jgi:site-specific DNA-methyltransferase (adenine-specific)
MPVRLIEGDCLDVLPTLEADSVDLILTDPPYYRVKGEHWDRQWDNPTAFIAWMGQLCEQWQRVLKPNGSLYVFASPAMAARVECEVARWFEVLSNLVWLKPETEHRGTAASKEALRAWWPASERIIFAGHLNADAMAMGESGYACQCARLRSFVFEPLRRYLVDEWERAGLTSADANTACGTQMAGHYFGQSQWTLPTARHYASLQRYANRNGGEYLRREYEDLRREYEDLRREYEDLRREYEDLRRPFAVTAQVQYTDVWRFATVATYPGRHPCEKPQGLLRHIIAASSRPGALVLDCFAGTASTGIACAALGRDAILIERDADYIHTARERLAVTNDNRALLTPIRAKTASGGLFAEEAN